MPARTLTASRAGASVLLLAALVFAAALAAAPAPTPQDVDRDLQALKDEALRLNRDIRASEQAMMYPDQSMTTVYVAVKVSGFLLDEISVRVNENEPVRHTYTDSEALALHQGEGWHRLLRLRLDPGTYRLQAEFSGHFFDAKPGDAPLTGKVETLFEKGLSELDLLLPVSRNTRLDKPGLSEISRLDSRRSRPSRNVWLPQPQRFETALSESAVGGLNDPRYRTALFLKNDGRFLSALGELLEIERTAVNPAALPGAYWLLLGECYVGFGMKAQAEDIYARIAAGPHDSKTLARAQLQLAQFEYQRGYHGAAIERLARLQEKLPSSLKDEWRLAMTSALLAQERYNEVVQLLARNGEPENDLPPVLRYNLAVALMRDGHVAAGRRELNRVGTMDVTNLETLVLRDKANLTLGYQYLQAQRGANAGTVFGRIRTTGPFANRALLGLGWSEIAPPQPPDPSDLTAEAEGKNTDDSLGTLLRPGYVDPKARARVEIDGQAVTGPLAAEKEPLLRALVPWAELAKRDMMSPAVQEGLLAIPWALDQLGAYQQSLKRYLDAIAALETARKRMDDAMKSIRGGRMVQNIIRRDVASERGWQWRLRDLPDAPETYFLQNLLAEHRFQEQLKNFRDARLLARQLDAWNTHLAELARPMAGGGTANLAHQLQRARQGWQPTWSGTVVWLGFDTALGAPGAYDAPLKKAPDVPLELRTLAPPATFEGRSEQLRPLRSRIEALRPRIVTVANAQDDLLEVISLKELEGQKAVIERYLTEARFAVARIYDRQLKGAQ